jgi:hypothetical protein
VRLGCHRIRGWVLLTRLQFFVELYADIEGADIGRQFLHLHMLHCLTCAALAGLHIAPASSALHGGSSSGRVLNPACWLAHCQDTCFEYAAWGSSPGRVVFLTPACRVTAGFCCDGITLLNTRQSHCRRDCMTGGDTATSVHTALGLRLPCTCDPNWLHAKLGILPTVQLVCCLAPIHIPRNGQSLC